MILRGGMVIYKGLSAQLLKNTKKLPLLVCQYSAVAPKRANT